MKIFNKILLLFILFFLCSFIFQSKEIDGVFRFFTTDNIGNIYAITAKNDIVKYDRNGNKKAEINLKVFGEITSIDAVNPFEIYVFYRDYGKIIYFDNNLNKLGETDLYSSLGKNNIQAVCRSYDNGFWFVDSETLKLKKCDKKGIVQTESVFLSTLSDSTFTPQFLIDDGKFVYLKFSNNKIMKFDGLANFISTYKLPQFTTFQLKDENIYFKTNESYFVLNTITFEISKFQYEFEKKYLNIRNEGKTMYLQDTSSIKVVYLKD